MLTCCSEIRELTGQREEGRKIQALYKVMAPIPGIACWLGEGEFVTRLEFVIEIPGVKHRHAKAQIPLMRVAS